MKPNLIVLLIFIVGLSNLTDSIPNRNDNTATSFPEDTSSEQDDDDSTELEVKLTNKTSTNVTSAEYENDPSSLETNKTDKNAIADRSNDTKTVILNKIARFLSALDPATKLESLLKKYNGSLIATIDKQDDNGPVMHLKGIEQFWQSEDGKNKLQGSGYYDKRYNGSGQQEDRYGAKLSLTGPLVVNNDNILNNNDDNNNYDDGSVDIGLNRLNSRGTQLSFDTSQNLWRSADGRSLVKGEAYYKKQFGTEKSSNRYDSIGGQLTFEGVPPANLSPVIRFNQPITARARFNHEPGKDGTDVYVEANGKLWSNDNETAYVKTKAYYKKNFGKLAGHNYGTRLDFNNKDELKVAIDLKKDLYRAPRLNVDLRHRLWKSADGKDEFEANGYYSKHFENNSKSDEKFGFGIVLNHMLG